MKTDNNVSEMEYNVFPLKQKKNRGATKVYLTLKDKVEIMKECGDASLILFDFYLTKTSYMNGTEKGYDYMDDAKTAKSLGWSKFKVRDNRQKLMKNNWMKIVKGRYNNGKKIIKTFLGKEVVEKELSFESNTPIREEEVSSKVKTFASMFPSMQTK
jgi:hypothetical protein